MEDIFVHDASPVWSGFYYQELVTVYLALQKICELRERDVDIEAIGEQYLAEIENYEDTSIVRIEGDKREYLSLHQIKNEKDIENISGFREPLVQLMMEKGAIAAAGKGCPDAFLHISDQVSGEERLQDLAAGWKKEILVFYNELKLFTSLLENGEDAENLFIEVTDKLKKEPIKINRADYRKKLKEVESCGGDSPADPEKLAGCLCGLTDFLENKLHVNAIDEDVRLYAYEDGKFFCPCDDIYEKIVEQVRRYEDDSEITEGQYRYITNKLLTYVRDYIFKRHKNRKAAGKGIFFREFIHILDIGIREDEKEANLLALRRIYMENLSEYCMLICNNACREKPGYACLLMDEEFVKNRLDDEEFIKFCYGLNPDCSSGIEKRECLNGLMSGVGLRESVFHVIGNISRDHFIRENETRIVVDNKHKNAFLTAISDSKESVVTEHIIKGMKNHATLISPIFESDQLITVSLNAGGEVWDSEYSYIRTAGEQCNICNPKKPEFVTADRLVNSLNTEDGGV